jgi:putative ABC transport system permease protein
MVRASWKSLLARRLRLFMSAFAVVLGVAFVAGSLVFTDTLSRAFDGIMTGSVGDVVVRPAGGAADDGTQTTRTLPRSVVTELATVDGAARADGKVMSYTTFVIAKDGKVIGGQGAPGLATNYSTAPAGHDLKALTLTSGREPRQSGEVALDGKTAESAGYRVGDTVQLVSAGARPVISATLVGIVDFGNGGTVGASVATFDTKTAQELFLGGEDAFSDAWVTAAPGVSQAALRDTVAARLPAGFEAITGEAAAKEAASDINEGLSFIGTFLLVFAGISLVVGSFIIVNTFAILVAQRSRELALFRAIGATRRQVTRSVTFEALVIGLVGSTVGLGLGFALAMGITALFASFGLDLTGTPLVFQPRTALVAYAVGLVVTLAAAWLPARRAGRIPPVAAMRDDVVVGETSLHRRVILGGVMSVAGAGALTLGLVGDVPNAVAWVGGGVLFILLGVALTSPLVGRPVVAGTGLLFRKAFGSVGLMAEQNAVRNPRRTAATASALMIGLTLVSMMAVFGQSSKASIDQAIAGSVEADYVVSSAIMVPFSPSVADRVAEVPGVESVARYQYVGVSVAGARDSAGAVEPEALDRVLPVEMVAGSMAQLVDGTTVVEDEFAAAHGVKVGDVVTAKLAGTEAGYRVVGIYRPSPSLATSLLLTMGSIADAGVTRSDSIVYVKRAPGADAATVAAGIEKTLADLPTVTLKDQAEFAAEERAPIDQMLYIIYALLGLAVVIAVLGIVNTLALSVIERTREIGLLRAIGLGRGQLRTMLRLESVVIALLGAVLGIGLGVGFGAALQHALADEGITVLEIPFAQLAGFVAMAVVIGVLAAVWPGRRAARLDVLRAVTTE